MLILTIQPASPRRKGSVKMKDGTYVQFELETELSDSLLEIALLAAKNGASRNGKKVRVSVGEGAHQIVVSALTNPKILEEIRKDIKSKRQ